STQTDTIKNLKAQIPNSRVAGDSIKPLTTSGPVPTDTRENLISQISNSKSNIRKEKSESSKTDSTDRYFEAFYHVRIFSDSVQAVADSMFYSFKDSVFRLYKNPVV